MKNTLNSRQQASILILILLFHALVLIVMFMIEQQHALQETLAREEPIVMFEQEQATVSAPAPHNDWVAIESASFPTPPAISEPQQSLPEEQVKQVIEESIQEETTQKDTKELTDQAIADALSVAQQVLGEPQEATALMEDETSEQMPSEKKEISQDQEIKKVAKPHQVVQQKQVTFAQLAEGFAQHVQATLTVKSDKQGTASVDQIKHINFCQKILSCLVNSYKINNGAVPPNKIMGNTLIQLALNQNGSIHTLKFLQSSGNVSMDQFILHMFQDASSSFPPVPASFEKPYQLPVFSFDRVEVFQSASYWHINTTK